ncbi:MAG TPA: asparagine synthase (glutamine-hydrolyzing) [Caulobacteraceae bacterium]|jgi:asparagine synthase (glutamine-hydrolysing)|nr:asparagine synthase (glutamine-hydrolyzing) [Caulobacteraceae bacterium]
MCGIAGLVGHPAGARQTMARMLDSIRHRGPDDEGVWEEDGACLGQRRLAIIDTSQAGHQPMESACGRYVLTMNGEIYNYRLLRAELEAGGAIAWRGHSDTEVLLETIARHGVAEALAGAKGMFALGLWDRRTRTAWLARDRMGEKPLYYSTVGGRLAFASELRALETLPGLPLDLSSAALGAYFRYGYVPAPLSIYSSANKLAPGSLLTWREGEQPRVAPYWRLADVVRAGQADRLHQPAEAVAALDRLLRDVVERQMIADVPLGVFLSGGIDSSLVAAIMQSLRGEPIRTFTLGFDSSEFNEAEHAAAVARHIGSRHTEHIVTAADAQAIAPRLGQIYDEPFADSSQIPTYLISRMACSEVKVCLTGDGGDEMFGGYVRYPGVRRLWNAMRLLPARGWFADRLEAMPLERSERSLAWLGPLARRYASRGALGPSLRRGAGWLRADSREALFEATMSYWPSPEALLADAPVATWRPEPPAFDSDIEPMLWRDTVDYLPGDILAKVDRAAMANSLETRAPLLDPDVAALAWRLVPSLKVRGHATKWIVRQLLDRYVPSALTERPKVGFTVPLHEWLTGSLRGWARELLDPVAIVRQGVLNGEAVEAAWRGLESGDSGEGPRVWSVLMFQAWQAARGRY